MNTLKVVCFAIFLISSSRALYAQEIMDTIDTPNGKMVVYENRTWEYLKDINFDGVLNETVHNFFSTDTAYNYVWPWDINQCYSSNKQNDLLELKDTLWICVTDSLYNNFVMPFDGRITSRYGYRRGRYHNGIDIDLQTGDSVVAAFDGKVRYAQYNDEGFGNLVVIRHYNGLETFYAHLSILDVVPNQEVKAGELIGRGGNTGHSYGSHLHFETRFYDASMNPEEIIDFKNKCIRNENLFIHAGLFQPGASPSYAAISGGGQAYYRIRRGDTLSSIARRHKTTVGQLCRLNKIRATTTLRVGRTLRVQ